MVWFKNGWLRFSFFDIVSKNNVFFHASVKKSVPVQWSGSQRMICRCFYSWLKTCGAYAYLSFWKTFFCPVSEGHTPMVLCMVFPQPPVCLALQTHYVSSWLSFTISIPITAIHLFPFLLTSHKNHDSSARFYFMLKILSWWDWVSVFFICSSDGKKTSSSLMK